MSHHRQSSQSAVLVKTIAVMLLSGRAVFGQDGVVEWDPRETGELTFTWKTVLIALLLALACCGLWKLLMWWLESRRAAINWPKVRLWWPAAMLGWGWVILAMFTKRESWGWVFDATLGVFGVLNFPALLLVAAILESVDQPAIWVRVLIGSSGMWATNYLMVRLAEWRAWINVPVSLQLLDADTRPGKPT